MQKTVCNCSTHIVSVVDLTAAEEAAEASIVGPPAGLSDEEKAAHDAIHAAALSHPDDPVLHALDVLLGTKLARMPAGVSINA